ncbi:ferredoxin [Nocardia spumae]|uniref:ferredoxin n=1 Tax=Nocardia spumae TaxID=2887190 RepID=UPI001D14959A|nr:ferredoxin [Nocardia spumae]
MTPPIDERIRDVPMAPVGCHRCGARVLARKSSRAQTSIQWDAASTAACMERHAASALSEAGMRHCSALRESIWAAAESGELSVLDNPVG